MENVRLYKEFFNIKMEDLGKTAAWDDYKALYLQISKWMEDMESSLASNASVSNKSVRPFGNKKTINSSAVDDEKENFLMPAPKGRAPRNKNRNTKSTLNVKPTRPARVTRSSRINEDMVVDEEDDVQLNKSKRRTRATKIEKDSVCSESHLLGEMSVSELSATESKKGRRSTRKGTVPKTSRSSRGSRASYLSKPLALGSRITRNRKTSVVTDSSNAQNRMTRSKALNDTMNTSKILEIEEVQNTKRVTRNKAAAVESVADTNNDKSPAVLFSPYGKSSVKQRVKAFEGLTESNKAEEGESSANQHAAPCISSPVPNRTKAIVDSPLKKGKSKRVKEKDLISVTENLIDCVLEEEEEIVINRTFQVVNKNGTKKNVTPKNLEEALEADDEWVSDDDKCSSVHSSKKKLLSSSPKKGKKAAEPKVATGSTKVLRGRSVQKTSTEVPIASGMKTKPAEIELKEAELKKKMEKEEEARKRKEVIIKKRTETMKKKREEKMAKVKRTREELEKDTKTRKGRRKKATPTLELEEVVKTPPVLQITPVLNSTFNVKDKVTPAVDACNITPCWQDVSPVQPENPDDYGVADKSGCSSEEENDPRKKVPQWAQSPSLEVSSMDFTLSFLDAFICEKLNYGDVSKEVSPSVPYQSFPLDYYNAELATNVRRQIALGLPIHCNPWQVAKNSTEAKDKDSLELSTSLSLTLLSQSSNVPGSRGTSLPDEFMSLSIER